MADALRVQPCNGLGHLAHETRGLLLRVGPALDEPLKELATSHQLHDQVPLVLRRARVGSTAPLGEHE